MAVFRPGSLNNPLRVVINISLFLAALIWAAAIFVENLPDAQGTDFYPIRVALSFIASGQSPYGSDVDAFLQAHWEIARLQKVAPVVAYPLPALIPLLPLHLLPDDAATPVWLVLLLALVIAAAFVARRDPADVACVLLFYPVVHGLALKTSTMLWLPLVLIMETRLRRGAFILAFAPLKPQVGLLFALRHAARLWHGRNFSALALALATLLALCLASFAVVPDWPLGWFGAVRRYQEQAVTINLTAGLLPIAVLAAGVLPAAAVLAVATLALFPINDLYSTAILLMFWRALKPAWALGGVLLGWLGPLFWAAPNGVAPMAVTVLLPVVAVVLIVQNVRARDLLLRPISAGVPAARGAALRSADYWLA